MLLFKRVNILVVDDESGVRSILSCRISRSRHQVTTAIDGSEALRCVARAKTPFELIITDHQMPGMSGCEFVRQLREICLAGKVIVFSAHVSAEDERRYHDLDVKKMLVKSGGFGELIGIVDSLGKLSPEGRKFYWLQHGTALSRGGDRPVPPDDDDRGF